MSFIETEASYRIEVINGKPVKIITPQTEVTLTNMKTGQEYNSDAEAMQDVQNPETETIADDIKRDVKVTVEALPLGGDTKLQYTRTMAITRAQIARELYIKGGVVNPDGRRGFFQGALDDAKNKNQPISPGTSVGGNTRGGTGRGRDLDVQQRGMTKSEYNRRVAEGTIDRYKGSDDPPKPPQLQEDKRFVPTEVPKGISAIERLRNDQIQKSINRNRVLALRKLGLMKKPCYTSHWCYISKFGRNSRRV